MSQKEQVIISEVRSVEELSIAKELFRAYADWLGIDLAYQGFKEELAGLPGKYAPPDGALLLARNQQRDVLGCVALRPFALSGACEMKRLYVLPEGRGAGCGKALIEQIVKSARALGYSKMLLDTLPSMTGAISLYKRAGFEQVPAYYETPIEETIFFQLNLNMD